MAWPWTGGENSNVVPMTDTFRHSVAFQKYWTEVAFVSSNQKQRTFQLFFSSLFDRPFLCVRYHFSVSRLSLHSKTWSNSEAKRSRSQHKTVIDYQPSFCMARVEWLCPNDIGHTSYTVEPSFYASRII